MWGELKKQANDDCTLLESASVGIYGCAILTYINIRDNYDPGLASTEIKSIEKIINEAKKLRSSITSHLDNLGQYSDLSERVSGVSWQFTALKDQHAPSGAKGFVDLLDCFVDVELDALEQLRSIEPTHKSTGHNIHEKMAIRKLAQLFYYLFESALQGTIARCVNAMANRDDIRKDGMVKKALANYDYKNNPDIQIIGGINF